MMDGFGFDNINALSSLLHECKDSEDAVTNARQTQPPITGAGSTVIKTLQTSLTGSSTNAGAASAKKSDAKKDIWEVSEIPTEDSLVAVSKDSRPCPQYEISYKQSVGTEDTFLGLSNKTPSSEDCTHLVVKVHFPGSKMRDLDLDVTKNRIKAESSTLRLFTYLPRAVDHENGNAKFDPKRELLIVTLPILPDE